MCAMPEPIMEILFFGFFSGKWYRDGGDEALYYMR